MVERPPATAADLDFSLLLVSRSRRMLPPSGKKVGLQALFSRRIGAIFGHVSLGQSDKDTALDTY